MYVVTFNRGNPTAIAQLRQMSLADARAVLATAARIPKRGMIVRVDSLEIVDAS